MAMRHISKALAGVMADIEAKRAANAPHEFDAPTPSRMEAEDEQGRAPQGVGAVRDAEERAPRTGIKKAGKPFGGDSPPASMGQRHVGGTARLSYWSGIAPDLRIVASNDGRGRIPRHASEIAPSRGPRLSLVVCGPQRAHG